MSDNPDPILELKGVVKRYGNVQVLDPLDLTINDREFLTILGPSGSGKTTVIRMIGGFTDVTEGKIHLSGQDITNLPTFKRPFNTVFQDYALFPHMTVGANVGYGLSVRGTPKVEINKRVAEVLEIVELGDKAGFYPSELSGGQQQRIALARAIVGRPRVVLLDEPLSALDAELRRSMQIFLKDLQQKLDTTFIFITHDQEEAISMSDRIVVMDQGRVAQVGTPNELYHSPSSLFVARFFGENNIMPATPFGKNGITCPLGNLPIAAPAGLAAFSVSIRPEDLHFDPPGTAPMVDRTTIKATIRRASFLGPVWEIIFATTTLPDHEIKARVASSAIHGELQEERTVSVSFDPARISLIVEN